ncbi:DHH family phosphoesterase [Alishewanella tabrizica]|uniref:Acetyltransferase n=1 Tax=Alishewanella tabrizica TaxID=671278 RepID=A0ABQ2WIT5_9ALTE|nr:DHH family phosphoesterase [Alishewanella tabrizica]GGW58703.1 acetyltransferase [Alishewanella tabrizica]
MVIDVFNGDADGILSLVQLRKCYPVVPAEQRLITGVKRDISLVKHVSPAQAAGVLVTVLDISFDKNVYDVKTLLEAGSKIFYCDHHQAKTLFEHAHLTTLIDTSPAVCTALLMNQHLNGAQVLWAIAAAFGDGLDSSAEALAAQWGLSALEQDKLKSLGVLVNYNGYGAHEADLFFPPAELYRLLMQYESPFAVVDDPLSPYAQLEKGYNSDLAQARHASPLLNDDTVLAVHLADEPWARRISGTLGNILAAENRRKAIVIATTNQDGSLTISLRAPKENPFGAAEVCGQFVTGGGREGAAGINNFPSSSLSYFLNTVSEFYFNSCRELL